MKEREGESERAMSIIHKNTNEGEQHTQKTRR